MGRKSLDNSMRDSILLMFEKGFRVAEIVTITGVSIASVNRTIQADKLGKVCNRDGLRKMLDSGNGGFVAWACEKYGINLDEEQPQEKPKKEPPTECDIEDAIHVASRLVADKVTEQIHTEAEMLAKKLDQIATIIQSVCKEATMKQNANADIALQEAKKQTEALSWIRSNTKRKGFQ